MRVELVTSFSPAGAEAYGRRCVASVRAFWPHPLVVYLDKPLDWPGVRERMTYHIPGWLPTKEQLPSTRPDAPQTGHDEWTRKPASYLWNAQRFAVKPFVWLDAAERLGNGLLAWLDGDTVTTNPVPASLIADLLWPYDVAYLGRGAMHPETGFVAFRLPQAMPLLRWCCDAYRQGGFREWSDGWTDCHALRAGIVACDVEAIDLTSHRLPWGEWRSHVDAFALSRIGPYVEHLKGQQRKRPAESSACQ